MTVLLLATTGRSSFSNREVQVTLDCDYGVCTAKTNKLMSWTRQQKSLAWQYEILLGIHEDLNAICLKALFSCKHTYRHTGWCP